MIQWLEIAILSCISWFYSLPWIVGLFTVGAAGTALIMLQYFQRDKRVLPGLSGIVLAYGCYLHVARSDQVINVITSYIRFLETARGGPPPIPFVEPLFNFFAAPRAERLIHQEVLFVVSLVYLGLVAYESIREYRKTGVLLGELRFSSKAAQARPERSTTNELGSADLATTDRIMKWTKPRGPGDTFLTLDDIRGSEGLALKHGKLILPPEERNRHMLIVAKTGSGKTTRAILPVLYSDCMDPQRSTIIIDSKPEMWRKLAYMTRKYNPHKNILLFNPLDVARTLSWNLLGKIEDETDCKLISNTIIMATDQPQSKSDSPFFRNNALQILNSIMVGLLHDKSDVLSIPRIHELVQSGMKPLCNWLEAHPHAIRNTRTFVELARSGSQNADTIMSELSMRLSAWDLPDIRATTGKGELDIEELISRPTLFIVELRESELEMLRPMANVIVVELLRFLTKRAESCPGSKLPRPVGLVIDEFASAIGRLPDIHVKLNTLRSRNVSIMAAIQSIAQIKANYGDDADSVIAGFSTKIFMPTLDVQDSEFASKETGQMTIRFKTLSQGTNKKIIEWFASKNDSSQEQVQQRAVLTPDEVGRPVDNIATIFMPDTPVFQGHFVPYYKMPEMLQRIEESEKNDLVLRTSPINYDDSLKGINGVIPGSSAAGAPAGGSGAVPMANGLPPGITDTHGWSDEKVLEKLAEVREKLDWANTTGSARKWWEAFEAENKVRMPLVLRLGEELLNRQATVTEFFLSYVYSNTDNIQANLHYLDYSRLKKEEEKKKRETAESMSKAA